MPMSWARRTVITLRDCSMPKRSVEVLFFQAEDGIRDLTVTGVQTCALPICRTACLQVLLVANIRRDITKRDGMNALSNRREFLRAATLTGAGLTLSNRLPGAKSKAVLVFTKSSGWEHDVVKRVGGKPSIVDDVVNDMGNKYGFKVGVTKDGRIFDSKEFHSYAAVLFFTTGDLTTLGTDGKPPMTPQGKQTLLEAVQEGMGVLGVHAASDTFHTQPDPPDLSNRYIAHGDQIGRA